MRDLCKRDLSGDQRDYKTFSGNVDWGNADWGSDQNPTETDKRDGCVDQRDYKTFSPNVDWGNVDWDSAPAIQDTNVQSAIVEPKPGSSLEGPLDEVEVRGFAFSGGGKGIIRVDVSADGGKSWFTANLHPVDSNLYRFAPFLFFPFFPFFPPPSLVCFPRKCSHIMALSILAAVSFHHHHCAVVQNPAFQQGMFFGSAE